MEEYTIHTTLEGYYGPIFATSLNQVSPLWRIPLLYRCCWTDYLDTAGGVHIFFAWREGSFMLYVYIYILEF